MNYRKKFMEYFDNRVDGFLLNCALGVRVNDPEGIHQMRVENKRLRALYRLLESLNPAFDSRLKFKPFRRYSKKSGQLRDSHVQIQLVRAMQNKLGANLTGFLNFLQIKKDSGDKNFRKFNKERKTASVFKTRKPVKSALGGGIADEVVRAAVAGHCERMKAELVALKTEGRLDQSIMHLVRILSKEAWYTFQIAQQAFDLYTQADQFMASLKSVHQSLGKWHDYDLCLSLLDEYLGDTPADQIPEIYARLKALAVNRRKYNRDRFRKAFNQFVSIAAAQPAPYSGPVESVILPG